MNKMNIAEKKRKIRQRELTKRHSLTDEYIAEISHSILERLKSLEVFSSATTIHCYLSSAEKKEIQTRALISWLTGIGKRVLVPRTEVDFGMSHIEIGSEQGFTTNRWGISEPLGGTAVDSVEIDIVLVPMVAADAQKNRLGYGKGYYDRFLSSIEAFKIGLTANMFVLNESLPADTLDIPMDVVVTEERTID